MNRILAALPLAVAALAAIGATPTAAQVAGVYAGTSLDGNGVNFTVATDPNTGVLAVTGAGIGFSALCRNGTTLNTGWGYGTMDDIVNRRVADTSYGPYYTISFHLTFSRDGQSATGMITTISSMLTPEGSSPTSVQYCKSPMQSVTVTLQTPASHAPPPAKGAVWLGDLKTGAK